MKITREGYAIIERDTHIGKWVEEHKRLDFDQNALPQMLPYIKEGDTVLDIGANIGCYAYAFREAVGNPGKVFCFEPNEEAFECLTYNLRNYSNIHKFNTAVSHKSFEYAVNSEHDNVGMAFIEPSDSGKSTITIDSLEFPRCDFLKLDCEGFELEVLKGAELTIVLHKPVMVIEINDHTLQRTNTTRESIFKWLDQHGYTYRNIYKEQDLTGEQLDIICFPK